MIERLFEKENIDSALVHLAKKYDAISMDVVKLSDLPLF